MQKGPSEKQNKYHACGYVELILRTTVAKKNEFPADLNPKFEPKAFDVQRQDKLHDSTLVRGALSGIRFTLIRAR